MRKNYIGANKGHERYCKNILMTTFAPWNTYENQVSVNVCVEVLWGHKNILDAKVKISFIPENCILSLLKLSYTKSCIKKSILIAEEIPLNF